jgi:hypothetical protein
MAVQLENTEKLCRTMSNAKPQLKRRRVNTNSLVYI